MSSTEPDFAESDDTRGIVASASSGPWALDEDLVTELNALSPDLVVETIAALQAAAAVVLGDREDLSDRMFVFGPDGAQAFADRWDVLMNEAEWRCSNPAASRDLMERTWDPAWRVAFHKWALRNEVLFKSRDGWAAVANAAASLSLSEYRTALAEAGEEADEAVSAGLLPCSSALASEHPDLARLVLQAWRIMGPHSPAFIGRRLPDDLIEASETDVDVPSAEEPRTKSEAGTVTAQDTPLPSHGHAQAAGQTLEESMFDVLSRLFLLDEDTTGQTVTDLRRQLSGSQFGSDLIIRTRAIRSNSTCLVECKNYRETIQLRHIAEKLLQAQEFFGSEPVDYWVLISPHSEPSNELDLLVAKWNLERRYPFQIQIWSPQTGIRDLLALSPASYRQVYGSAAGVPTVDAHEVIESFSGRLMPWLRVPAGVKDYLWSSTALVQPNERGWLSLLETRIERRGLDADGRPLDVPLQEAILRSLDSPRGASTALLTADFGEGKSFFTVALCTDLRARFLANPTTDNRIPFRFYLRDFRKIDSAAEFLMRQLDRLGVSRAEWESVAQQWSVLVVLDGMDEMSVSQDVATTRINFDKINDLLEELAGIPVVVTSRPNFFGSERDKERFYDRLRRPVVFQLAQPDRVETVGHLRHFANEHELGPKLDRIKELYDPVGLAGKVLFLEMIKATLPDLPEDQFNERILYETYIDKSFRRKVELLRDDESSLTDAELFSQLIQLLEEVAVAIHAGGEGTVNLRTFLDEAGGAASLLWKTADADGDEIAAQQEDATVRVGGRSLLRRHRMADDDNENSWLVAFFHRSMKEYFVARAIVRALGGEDPFASTRSLLKGLSIQPEIIAFFGLLSDELADPAQVLSSIAHSARSTSQMGLLGGVAVSLYNAVQGNFAEEAWSNLNLDGALLGRANLAGVDLRGSSLRGANFSSADLTGADLRGCDLTDANLGTGDLIVDVYAMSASGTFVGLTSGAALLRIRVDDDLSMSMHDVLDVAHMRWPRRVFALAEDVLLVVGDAEASVVRLGANTGEEVARFRVANTVRAVDRVGEDHFGLLLVEETGLAKAVLVDVARGEVQWVRMVPPDTTDCRWVLNGVVSRSLQGLIWHPQRGESVPLALTPEVTCLRVGDTSEGIPTVLYGSSEGLVIALGAEGRGRDSTNSGHAGSVTGLAEQGSTVLSTCTDGAIALWKVQESGLTPVGVTERRLRCEAAQVSGLEGAREHELFLANGAVP